MQAFIRGRWWHWAFAGLLLALEACAGKPFGRPVPQPPVPALPLTASQPLQPLTATSGVGATGSLVALPAAAADPAGVALNGPVIPAGYTATGPRSFRDLRLCDAVEMAMQNSSVIRDLGGRVVSQPGFATSNLNPALIGSDPRGGIDAALSAFDAQLLAAFNGRKFNRGLQQFVFQSPNTEINQHQSDFQLGARRTLTTGTNVGLSHFTNYRRDDLGQPPNRFSSAYTMALGGDIRHPLALGSGRDFNLIAGPNSQPGQYNGLFIARVRQDIAHHDFEIAVRDYVGNVVRSYWLLCFAYERMEARERSLAIAEEVWKAAKTKLEEGTIDADVEALARDRYLAEQIAHDNALVGSPDRTLAGILGTSGTLLTGAEPGVEANERRLRYLIGLPAYDGTILRPVDRPSFVPLTFDANESLCLALQRRPELRRQNLVVHQKQMELVAARSFARPKVDLVSEVRILGFGDHLGGQAVSDDENALHELLQAQLQEWAMGVEVQRPVGLRLGRTAERNALLSVSKEAEVLRQQQVQVSHEINAALAEVDRAQKVLELTRHRRDIAFSHQQATERKFVEGLPIAIEQVLEAQRAMTDAESALSIAAVDRSIAINNLLIARGTYLQDMGLMLVGSDGASNGGFGKGVSTWSGLAPAGPTQIELSPPQSLQSEALPEIILLPPET